MKRVSFKVAKALKEAGYPFELAKVIDTIEGNSIQFGDFYLLPYYLEVWLWLWREKKIAIPADYFGYENNYWESCVPIGNDRFEFFSKMNDPEEAIIAAIEYLVEHNLIK